MGGVSREAWTRFVEGARRAQAAIDDVVKAAGKGTALERPNWLDAPKPRTKYGNRATVRDGIRFHSRLEADRYSELKLLQEAREVLYFQRQVPFYLEAGVTWRADFLVFWRNKVAPHYHQVAAFDVLAGVTIEDTKGLMTDVARLKIKQVESRYQVRVRILKRSDVRRFADANA